MRKFWLTAYEPEVQRELFRLGHHNLSGSVLGGIVTISVLGWLTWGTVATRNLAIWLGLELLAMALGVAVWARFRRAAAGWQQADAATLRRWMWGHIATIGYDGVASGCVGLLFAATQVTHNMILMIAFVGAGAFSAIGNAPHNLPAYLLTVVLAMGLMTQFLPVALGADAPLLIGLCWLYAGMLAWVALQAHRSLVDSVRLRLANERLAAEHDSAARQARQANRDKSDFLAAASHDLRQPVHALVLLIEALRQRRHRPAADARPDDEEQDRLIDSIGQAAQAISQLFGGLMELSRLESGRDQPQLLALQPAALLRQVMDRHAEQARRQGLSLALRVSPRVADAWVLTDRVMLERSLGNLLSNALRYTPRGGVLLTLRPAPEGGLRLGVHDSGIGIDAPQQQRVFDPYVQLANPERDRRLGMGLGLAIVRGCAQRLGLGLTLRSRPGHGSSFTLTLPAALRCAAPSPAPPRMPSGDDALALAGRRVLLIDDDPMVRAAMLSLLGGWQVDLRLAEHARDPALAELCRQGWEPQMLLCDQRLPGDVQGIELLGQLQDRWPRCAALLLTGEPPERVQAQAEEAGYPVLYKPVPAALLASTLRALMPPRPAPAQTGPALAP